MSQTGFTAYVSVDGAELFTTVSLPEGNGSFPVVVFRSPYVDAAEAKTDRELLSDALNGARGWNDHGYAVVSQHCRGRGHSTGDCIPYINEREDTLALFDWIRRQPFYGGELYLNGGSYTSSVFYVAAPFADDIKGAVFDVQDCERYNVVYRNGFFKSALHGNWYVGMYKKKTMPQKACAADTFRMLPLSGFSETVFGEPSPDLDETFRHPDRDDPFWTTHFGGAEAHNAVKSAKCPILLTTGFYDIYTGGVFDMWNSMDPKTRAHCALAVHPYQHSGRPDGQPVVFENGVMSEAFPNYARRWFDAIREKAAGRNGDFPFAPGRVTYYRLFDRTDGQPAPGWRTEDFADGEETRVVPFGTGEVTYTYNPYAPASFKGGLSCNFGGTAWQDRPDSRYDIRSFFSEPFEKDVFVKGRMTASLRVRSDCEDTCFYLRVSLVKEEGALGLRDDIQQISNFDKAYVPGSEVELTFRFDEHAFLVKKGERLRIDVSSSAYGLYVPHTNNRGLFSEQTTAKTARNTILLDASSLRVPCEASEYIVK